MYMDYAIRPVSNNKNSLQDQRSRQLRQEWRIQPVRNKQIKYIFGGRGLKNHTNILRYMFVSNQRLQKEEFVYLPCPSEWKSKV